VPSSTGSAYLEIENPSEYYPRGSAVTSLKLSCAVHGPKPLDRNANFSPNLQLTVNVKFAPFASKQRRGYIRDVAERDIGSHLETALKGVIIPDRWPKSAIYICFTIFESEDEIEQGWRSQGQSGIEGLAYMNVVSGCITAASAALLDARIDCLDLITGGVAAIAPTHDGTALKILDPASSEDPSPVSACVVAYMPARDEITLAWAKGEMSIEENLQLHGFNGLLDSAIDAAKGAHFVLRQVATEYAQELSGQIPNDDSRV
jgi:exosome complex component MTR3